MYFLGFIIDDVQVSHGLVIFKVKLVNSNIQHQGWNRGVCILILLLANLSAVCPEVGLFGEYNSPCPAWE